MLVNRIASRICISQGAGATFTVSLRAKMCGFIQSYPYRSPNLRRYFCAGQAQTQVTPFPVVLLSGFLGAGKTTVLEHLLRQEHGFKLGVIVNDLASVNVDANILRDAISDSKTKSVSLENGCVCCTASDDLQESVQSLLKESQGRLDSIVVELSGVAEPARVKDVLEHLESKGSRIGKPLSVRTVTIVDTPVFSTDYMKKQEHHTHHEGPCDHRFGTLLAEQVEAADLLLLNKADVATADEITQTQALLKVLNTAATVHPTEYGKLDVAKLLGVQLETFTDAHDAVNSWRSASIEASPDETAARIPVCCAAKTCSATNNSSTTNCESTETRSRAETRFGITSFVYRSEHMMSRARLLKLLSDWQKSREAFGNKLDLLGVGDDNLQAAKHETRTTAGRAASAPSPLAPILRSKGLVYVDRHPDVAFYWSHAGKAINFAPFGPWSENATQAEGGFGTRRTELVFIGTGCNEMAIRHALDSCLVSEEDLAFMRRMKSNA